jgi:hypothetical protein
MQEVRGSNPLSSTRSEACWIPIKIIREQNGEQAASYPLVTGSHAAGARRRGRNEGSIYKDEAKDRWYGAVSLGYGPDGKTWRRHEVSGSTRAEVAAKLKALQAEHDLGVQPSRLTRPAHYARDGADLDERSNRAKEAVDSLIALAAADVQSAPA